MLSQYVTTFMHHVLAFTHNVHRSTALSNAICVDDVHHPAQDPRV